MKNTARLFFLLSLIGFVFSCNTKNDAQNEGTELQEQENNVKGRKTTTVPSADIVTGTWQVKDVYIDNRKVENDESDLKITLRDDGTYEVTGSKKPTEKGTWKLSYSKTDILFKKEGSTVETFDYNYKISEREANEMTVTTYDNDAQASAETGVKVLVLERTSE